jgi:hypothetical protein
MFNHEVRIKQLEAASAHSPGRATPTGELMKLACPQVVGMLGGVFQVE